MIRLLLAVQDLPEGAELRRRLDRILASPEYSTDLPAGGGDGFLQAIGRWIAKAFGSLARLGEASPFFFWLILIACILVLLAIFLHAGIVLSRAIRESRAAAGGKDLDLPRGAEDPQDLLRRAREDARQGRLAEAARLSHRASVVGLGRRGLLRLHDTLTSGDCRRQLANHPAERTSFDALVRIYEPAWFGKLPVAVADVEACLKLADRLVQGAAS